jgi:hypothetical protein
MATAMRVLEAGARSLNTSHDAARLLDAALLRCHEELVTVCGTHQSRLRSAAVAPAQVCLELNRQRLRQVVGGTSSPLPTPPVTAMGRKNAPSHC